MEFTTLSNHVIGCAIEVHGVLGPRLSEGGRGSCKSPWKTVGVAPDPPRNEENGHFSPMEGRLPRRPLDFCKNLSLLPLPYPVILSALFPLRLLLRKCVSWLAGTVYAFAKSLLGERGPAGRPSMSGIPARPLSGHVAPQVSGKNA